MRKEQFTITIDIAVYGLQFTPRERKLFLVGLRKDLRRTAKEACDDLTYHDIPPKSKVAVRR